jgi:Ca2+-transporting ATPase
VFTNPTFLAVMLLILLGQIIIIQTGGSIFKVQPLGPFDWLIILAATSIVIIKAEVSRFFQRIRKNKAQA